LKRKTKLLVTLGILLAIAAGVFAGWGSFRAWRARQLIATAQAQYNQRDYRAASLGARAVLQFDPNNVGAYEILARISGDEHSPLTVLWRQKLVQLQPGKASPLLDLANTATDLGETFVAEEALNQVPATERNSTAFHQAAAAWSMALRQYANAERHFQQALDLDLGNGQTRLNLATVRLALSPPTGSNALRAELETLQKDPSLHLAATRALLADARRRGDAAGAFQLARELHASPDAGLADRLLYLEELQHAKSPEFDAELEALRTTATNIGSVYTIMEWMNGHGLAAKTAEWHATLAPAIQTQIPEPLAVAEAWTLLGDWKGLRTLVNGANWGSLEFLRLAYETRIFDEGSQHARTADFAGRWEHTVNSTAGNTNAIAMLARLVQSWGWKGEASQLWWFIANRSIGQRPALAALYELAMTDKNTRELYRVSRRLFEIEPASPVAKNNVAMFALLLGEDVAKAQKFAEEDFKLDPAQPVFLSTYAFSLYRQHRAREAADLLSKLPAEILADPSIAACYGAVLTTLGEKEKAQPFLDLARREKSRLFPEEAVLIEESAAPQPQ